jgi:hypothetical protein
MMGVLAAATGLMDRPIEGVRGVCSLTRHLRDIGVIDAQQERVMNGQAKAGDVEGAVRGMVRVWSRS